MVAAKTKTDGHSAKPRDAALRIAVLGSPQFTPTVAGRLRALTPHGEVVALGDFGLITGDAIALGAGAGAIVVVAAQGEGLSLATRQALLLAWGLGARPILVLVETAAPKPGTTPPGGALASNLAAWARGLGGRAIDWVAIPSGEARLAALLADRLAPGPNDTPFRAWIDTVASAPSGSPVITVETTLASGGLAAGHPVMLMPAARSMTAGLVEPQAGEPRSRLKLRLEGAGMDATGNPGAGELLAAADAPPEYADQVAAHIVWVDARPLLPGRPYRLRLGPQEVSAQVSTLKHRLNPADLDPMAARQLGRGEVGFCNLSFSEPILFDPFEKCPALGRFEILDPNDGQIAGFGRVAFTLRRATNIHWQALLVDKAARAALKGQRPCCLWFTGLSGSGKSTAATLLEKRLNAAGRHTTMLDGDNVRHGLNRDLGFTDADRVENIRRVSEVARLFVDSGLIVLVSFISPFRSERRMARELFSEPEFLEIFVDTPLAECERRDSKGLYKKARAGQLKNFTGLDSPYEPPEAAEIGLASGRDTPEALVSQIMADLARRGVV